MPRALAPWSTNGNGEFIPMTAHVEMLSVCEGGTCTYLQQIPLWLSFHLNSSKLAGRDSSGKTSSPTIRITRKGRLIAGFLLTSALVAEFNRGIVLNLSSLAAQQGREP